MGKVTTRTIRRFIERLHLEGKLRVRTQHGLTFTILCVGPFGGVYGYAAERDGCRCPSKGHSILARSTVFDWLAELEVVEGALGDEHS